MTTMCNARAYPINEKVPAHSQAFVQKLSEKLLGETALHKNVLSHEDPAKIERMIRIFQGYEHFSKYRQPPEEIGRAHV